ncbi:hypothetical protein [Leifsonia aquatica]|uniref:hypothetical protein n=1 Tax=Leifsonia aquatica TaxID=144185 RepID=UPI00380F9946
MAAAVERLAQRVADPDDFPVLPGSSLAGDDSASHPFEVSHAIRHLINASVDQLHAIKVLQHDAGFEHLAAGATLARAALENTATALWILGPSARNDRLERNYRWHVRNYQDEMSTVGDLVGEAPARHIKQVVAQAIKRGLNERSVQSGYAISKPVKGAAEFTDIKIVFAWELASAFAHGRPWAYQGYLARSDIAHDGRGHAVRTMLPRPELTIWLALEAMHLLGELLRLRDRRAGCDMPPMPDGSPDSGRPAHRPDKVTG